MLDYDCAYIPGNKVRMNYKYVSNASKKFATAVIARGWRRFGKYFFHPICNGCNECKSIRIDVNNYHYTKSQKKSIKRNADTKIIVQKPSLTLMHISISITNTTLLNMKKTNGNTVIFHIENTMKTL